MNTLGVSRIFRFLLHGSRLLESKSNDVSRKAKSFCKTARLCNAFSQLPYHTQQSCQLKRLQYGTRGFSQSQRMAFWGLDSAFNKVDEERVQLAGPDRACAEWVLRNGGGIRWTTSAEPLRDFNLLPTTDFSHYKLEVIDLSGTDVVAMGFAHLEHLQHVKSIILHGCRRISNESLTYLEHVKETLEELEISWCPMITEKGLFKLPQLKNLKHLTIYGLIEVRDLPAAVASLKREMPWCQISSEEPSTSE